MMDTNAARCWISMMLLAASGHWASSDLFHHMEDAFADDSTEKASERTLFCRLGNLDEPALNRLDPCLCSHLVFTEGTAAAMSDLWRKCKPNVHLLLTTPLIRWMRATNVTGLLPEIWQKNFDGIDVTVGEEAKEPEATRVLQEFAEQFRVLDSDKKVVSLTFVGGGPFLDQIVNKIDLAHFTFITDFTGALSNKLSELPRRNILYGLSLADVRNESRLRCSEIPSLSNNEEVSNSGNRENKKSTPSIRKEIENAIEQSKTAGIHIKSLTDDDEDAICGMGPFPILHYVQRKLNQDQEPFGEFADLDIILSTGESQELHFVQDLDATQDDLKKLPCDRVGFYRHPLDCTKFYHCAEFRNIKFNHSGPYAGFLYKCPSGLVYDEKQSSCIWPSWSEPCQGSAELMPVPAKKFSCETLGFHVDPENCRWFYYCSDLGDGQLEAFEFLCPSDLLGFDENKLLCNWKWTVQSCINYRKKPILNTNNISMETERTQHRTSKALKIHKIPLTYLNFSTEKPNTLKLNSHRNFTIANETLPVLAKFIASRHYENPQIIDDIPNTMKDIQETKNSSLSEKLISEIPKIPERTFRTAIWQRSWVNNKINNSKIEISQTNISGNSADKMVYPVHNTVHSHQYYSEINTRNKNISSTENGTELGRFFKGKVRKINLNGRTNQTPDSPDTQKTHMNREISPWEKNENITSQELRTMGKHTEDIVVRNDDVEILENPKPSPFVNIRCSKSQNDNQDYDDATSLGCTSEVTLTIKVSTGNDPSKYTLKDNQIRRTSYQESQILHLKIPNQDNHSTENDQDNINQPKKIVMQSYLPVDYKIKNKSINSSRNVNNKSIDDVDLRTSNKLNIHTEVNSVKKTWDIFELDSQFAIYNLSKQLMDHKKSVSDKYNDVHEKTYEIHDNKEIINKNVTKGIQYKNNEQMKQTEKNRNSINSMPIHFYPQGVLLNIDVAHVNKIPPQILLEVDNMLKKYMDDGDIDMNLLEEKLNTSVETMTAKKQESVEPKEVMNIIKVIENIINTSREIESVATESNHLQDEIDQITTEKTISISDTISQTEHTNVLIPEKNISDKIIALNNTSIEDKSKNQVNYDNIQRANPSHNVSKNTRAFGRRRLFQKFRYPSIHEQLAKQAELENPPYVIQTNNKHEVTFSSVHNTDTYPIFSYPLARNAAISHRADKTANIDFHTDSIQINFAPLSKADDKTKQISVLPYRSQLKAVEQQGNNYRYMSTNQALPTVHNNNNQQSLYLQNDANILENRNINQEKNYRYADKENSSYKATYSDSKNIQSVDLKLQKDAESSLSNWTYPIQTYTHTFSSGHETSQNQPQKFLSFQYGERTQKLTNERPLQYKTYSTTNPYLLRTNSNPNSSISRYLHENIVNLDDSNLHQNITQAKNFENKDNFKYYDRKKQNFSSSIQEEKLSDEPLSESEPGSLFKNSKDVNFQAQNIQKAKFDNGVLNEPHSDTNNKPKRKKKLRILVRKFSDNESILKHNQFSMDKDQRDIEQKISKNVLKALKNKLSKKHAQNIELQIQYQDHVWNVPFVNSDSESDLSPTVCTRPGLFQHPKDCNMFYECFWDKWLQRYTLHVFSCPVKLVYDESVRGCNRPTPDSSCTNIK